ncbi:MAG: hypothetical protein DRQ37_08635, partial [Gammaproteobacteria bacterium]
MNTSYEITTAQAQDVDALVATFAADMNTPNREHFQRKLNTHVSEAGFIMFLAKTEDRPVGLTCIQHEDRPPPDLPQNLVVELQGLACVRQLLVHPDFRGRSIGEALITRAELWARETGHPGCWCVTHRMGDWYVERFGYRELSPVKVKGANKHLMVRH